MAALTIKEIAKLAGVSIATVSRVINGTPNVNPDMVEKVEKVIKDSDFVPNSVARSLRFESTRTIGLIISDISNSYFNILAKVAEDIFRERDYSMIVCSTEEDKDRELNYLRLLVGRKVDGIILNVTGKNDDFISRLSGDLPMVLINRFIQSDGFRGDFIDSSNQDGVEMMVEHLYAKGHRRIGIINGDLRVSTGRERFEGFVRTMRRHGIAVDEGYPYRYDGHFHQEEGYKGAQYLLALPDRPTAIVVMNNAMAIGALKLFKAIGIRVPDDLSLVVYGDIYNSDILYVEPTYVTLNPYTIGKKAADYILERIGNQELHNREVIFAPTLVEGGSVKPVEPPEGQGDPERPLSPAALPRSGAALS
jgi:DNA-binding LacI/PurR family transcriptional regulator